MRPNPAAWCLLVAVYFGSTACATNGADRATPAGTQAPAAARADPQAPARELDLVPRRLPVLLAEALRYPYAPPSPLDCATIAARIEELDRAAGPDFDSPARPPAQDHTAARLLVSGIRSAIPYFGWLQRFTGADRRQRLAQSAFTAAHARRGYLKGLGQQLGCAPPAAPSAPVETMPAPMPAIPQAGAPR